MRTVGVNAFTVAQRFVGMKEVPGTTSNPAILAMLQLDGSWPKDDSVPWCSAFANYIAWLLRLPRSRSLAARSWLMVGEPVVPIDAQIGFDVVILRRGSGPQPGPENTKAPGHVGFFAGLEKSSVLLLAGNQGNTVSIATFPVTSILGVRRLA